jgi:hypothetical protein
MIDTFLYSLIKEITKNPKTNIKKKNRSGLFTNYSVLTISTGPLSQDQKNFVWTSKFFSFYLELYINKLRNLIQTSKFKFSFRGLIIK